MSDLAERIAEHLAGVGSPQTAHDIARALRVRPADVTRVLKEDDRFIGPFRVPGRSPKAKGYLNRPEPADG